MLHEGKNRRTMKVLPLAIIFVTKPCKALNEMQKKLTVLQQDAA